MPRVFFIFNPKHWGGREQACQGKARSSTQFRSSLRCDSTQQRRGIQVGKRNKKEREKGTRYRKERKRKRYQGTATGILNC